MSTVTGKTAAYVEAIKNDIIVSAHLETNTLVLVKENNDELNIDLSALSVGGGGGSNELTVNRYSTSITLSPSNDVVEMATGEVYPNTVTVPNNSSVYIPIGKVITICQRGRGLTTVVAAGGVTIHSLAGLASKGQFSEFTLIKVDVDEWYVFGDVTGGLEIINKFLEVYDSYTLTLDPYNHILMRCESANTFTIPSAWTVEFPIGVVINVTQTDVGVTTFVAAEGSNILSLHGLVSQGRYARMKLENINGDSWLLSGDLTT